MIFLQENLIMFTLDDVGPFLVASVKSQLASDPVAFNLVRDSVIEVIKSYVTLPNDLVLDKKFHLSAAWLMSYIYIQTFELIPETEQPRLKDLYDKAIAMLSDKIEKKVSKVGGIEGVWL
jgi:hypothetical protein